MFCTNCGNAMDDGTKFCPNCGAKVGGDKGAPIASENTVALPKIDKKILKKVVIGVVLAIFIIVAIIVATKLIRKKVNTINLNNYVKVTFDGYNGYGYADATIDWEGIIDDYGDKLEFNENISKSSSLDYIFEYEPEDLLIEAVSYKINKYDGLSNGDKIKYKWKVDDRAIERYINLDVKYSDLEYTVSDLDDIETYDVFANLKVSFVGASPNASVALKYTGDYIDNSDFSCDSYDALKDGDTITVELDIDADTMADEYGVVPAETSKEYKVKCTSKYIEKVSDISEESKAALKSQSDDVVATYIAGFDDLYYTHTLVSNEYLGDYCISTKGTETEMTNLYGMVYKITMQAQYSDDLKNVVMYYDVIYDNVSVDKDGKVETSILNYITSNMTYDDFHISGLGRYYGFESLTLLKSNRVDAYLAEYNYDWNVTEK